MVVKLLFGILFALAVISLLVGLFFLLKKQDSDEDKRILYALIARIGFSITSVAIITIALMTGKLDMKRNPAELDALAGQNKQIQDD